MKRLFLTVAIVFLSLTAVLACDISITVQGQQKSKYKTGEDIILKVKVTTIHKGCKINVADTKFNTEGLKIISGTEWVKVDDMSWERTIKLQVTAKSGEKVKFGVVRPCGAMTEEFIEFKV
jgi:hypothetical protein